MYVEYFRVERLGFGAWLVYRQWELHKIGPSVNPRNEGMHA